MKLIVPVLALLALVGCSSNEEPPSGPSSLVIQDLVIGTGETAGTGDTVTVHYTVWLADGTRLESSHDYGRPYGPFMLGTGSVIAGWDQGIVGMKVGGKRRLTVPPSLAYGNRQYAGIPPNSTLLFEVELMSVAH